MDKDADAPLAPLLATLKDDVERCYVHLDAEQDEVRETLSSITVVEPTFTREMPPEVAERIAALEAVKVFTNSKLYPHLEGSMGKWSKRCKALCVSPVDLAPKDIGPPVPYGCCLNSNLRVGKESWQNVARKSIQAAIEELRDPYSKEPSVEDKKKAKRDAFGGVFELVVRAVEAQEEKAIGALPDKEPDLTRALTERFALRAEAKEQRSSEIGVKAGNASIAAAEEEGRDTLAAANKELEKCKFNSKKISGRENYPNNLYDANLLQRFQHDLLEADDPVSRLTGIQKKKKPRAPAAAGTE